MPNFDSPADSDGDNEYNVQVRAEDGSKTGRLDVTVTITNVNDAPTTPTGREAITVVETAPAIWPNTAPQTWIRTIP